MAQGATETGEGGPDQDAAAAPATTPAGAGRRAVAGVSAGALLTALIWLAVWLWLVRPVTVGAGTLVNALSLGVPVALCVVAAALAHAVTVLEAETAGLRSERDRLRRRLQASLADRSVAPFPRSAPAEPARPATLPAAAGPGAVQAALPLTAETVQLTLSDLIRALHFPETAEDRAGFAALSRALRDHRAGLVIRAAQDMLELMSQDGIYVDDLATPRVGVADWRAFASGGDGREQLAGPEDETSRARVASRLAADVVYRDTAHHFLRRFDQMLVELLPDLPDVAVEAVAATRSARAFLLVGRAAGSFGTN